MPKDIGIERQPILGVMGHWLATAFHPELTPDTRLHELFLGMVAEKVTQA